MVWRSFLSLSADAAAEVGWSAATQKHGAANETSEASSPNHRGVASDAVQWMLVAERSHGGRQAKRSAACVWPFASAIARMGVGHSLRPLGAPTRHQHLLGVAR
jgi:hypothetical protein